MRTERASSVPDRFLSVVWCALLLSSVVVDGALADLPTLEWGSVQPIASNVDELASNGGRSFVFDFQDDGLWHTTFVQSGRIAVASGDAGGWDTPVTLTDGTSAARNPSIGRTDSYLVVVWEDDRSGHSEVWTSRRDGSGWSVAECLTCDGVPSMAPAFQADGYSGFVVWEEHPPAAPTSLYGRALDGFDETWGGVELIVNGTGARRPSLGFADGFGLLVVVWEDYRHGVPQIYSRDRFDDFWYPEQRVADLASACTSPSVGASFCCYDVINVYGLLAFEYDEAGTTEIWFTRKPETGGAWDPPARLSANDAVPSVRPDVGSSKYSPLSCYDFDYPISYVTWIDEGAESSLRFSRLDFEDEEFDEPVSVQPGFVPTVSGQSDFPTSPVFHSWLDPSGELHGRVGQEDNCRQDEIRPTSPYFFISPEGRSNEAVVWETCDDVPVAGNMLEVSVQGPIESFIAVDPEQDLRFFATTDENGVASFFFRGGGCVSPDRGAYVRLTCSGFFSPPFGFWLSVKSPDIDGTCTVDQWDVDYVSDRIGTDDFCADLDGSGWVDSVDLLIVETALGEACQLTSSTPTEAAGMYGIRAFPNPGRGSFEIRFDSAVGTRLDLQVIDVAGRLIRSLGLGGGERTELLWDGRDTAGQPVAAGRYFLRLKKADGTVIATETLVVVQ